MVTARVNASEHIRGLSVGADDYVLKPFSVPELMARFHALLRRSRKGRIAERLSVGNLDLDRPNASGATRRSRILLAPTEFRLLEFPMEKPGLASSRRQRL